MLKSVESLRHNANLTSRMHDEVAGGASVQENTYKETASKTYHQQSATLPHSEQHTLYTEESLVSKRHSLHPKPIRHGDAGRFSEISCR